MHVLVAVIVFFLNWPYKWPTIPTPNGSRTLDLILPCPPQYHSSKASLRDVRAAIVVFSYIWNYNNFYSMLVVLCFIICL